MRSDRVQLNQLSEHEVRVIFPSLDPISLTRIAATSKTMHHFFDEPLKIAKLHHCIIEANYSEAEKIVTANPEVIFHKIRYNSRTRISLLKLAIKILDTTMWEMFLNKIHGSNVLMKRFYEELREPIQIVNLKFLLTAYDNYRKQQERLRDQEINNLARLHTGRELLNLDSQIKKVDEAWLKVAVAQRDPNLFPRHMLKDFSRVHFDNLDNICDWRFNPTKDSYRVNFTSSKPYTSLVGQMCHTRLSYMYSSGRYAGDLGDKTVCEAILKARTNDLNQLLFSVRDCNHKIKIK
jgi:hypothetical protein